jgi:uncharacterized membrane protein YdbT with pleckstrin-like domain
MYVMGYVEKNLLPSEKIIIKAQVHWAIFIAPVIVIGMILLLAILFLAEYASSKYISNIFCFTAVFFLIGLVPTASSAITYFTTEFALTDQRIIAKTGLLRQRSLELMLTKVESIGVDQPLVGRLLNYGTIVVIGTGGTKEPFSNIADPMSLRQRINAKIAAMSGKTS